LRAAVIEGKRRFVVRDVPDPTPRSDEVVVGVQCCGVCGSDLHIYKEGAAISAGHEFAGDIVNVGSAVQGWSVGDRVAVEPRISCGECEWCREGDVGLCDQYYVALLEYEGAFATYARTRHTQLHRLPDEMPYEHAALAEPAACALHAIRQSGLKEGQTAAVLGLGTIGQMVVRIAKALGAKAVYAAEQSPSRIELARGVADHVVDINSGSAAKTTLELTGDRGADVVFECSGSRTATQDALAMVRKGGTVVIPGICFEWVDLPISNVVLRELTIRGSICFSAGEYASALELISTGRIDVASLVSVSLPLDSINEAFEMAIGGEGGKIFIRP